MVQTLKTIGAIGALLSLLFLAACGSPAPTSTPTPDLNPIRTEVAATVLAQVTRDLASTPSATPVPSLTPTNLPTSTSAQIASPTPGATATSTTVISGTAKVDQAQWVFQSVADGTNFAPGETFTMTWRLKNVGTSTWTPAYMLRFFSGDTYGASKEIRIAREVLPGETVDITIKMKAPTTLGGFRSDWVMSSENRRNFNAPVYLKINVAKPVTPTPSPTP
jgi:hypothetical protein